MNVVRSSLTVFVARSASVAVGFVALAYYARAVGATGLAVALDDADDAVEFRVAAVEPDDSVVLGPETEYDIEGPSPERSRRAPSVDLD